jgi:hypothetical protein
LYAIGGAFLFVPLLLALVVRRTVFSLADIPFLKPLVRQGAVEDRDDAPAGNEQREVAISGQVVRLIDLLFGLVIVQAAVTYRSAFRAHENHASSAVIVALVLVLYTVVRSFIDWHIHMEGNPFQMKTSAARNIFGRTVQIRTIERWRLYVDFVIVAAYSFLLLRAHVLLAGPGESIQLFFWTFPTIYLLYLVWGELLATTTGEERFSPRLLLAALVVSVILAVLYMTLGETGVGYNALFLSLELLLMLGYRALNWSQDDTIGSARA